MVTSVVVERRRLGSLVKPTWALAVSRDLSVVAEKQTGSSVTLGSLSQNQVGRLVLYYCQAGLPGYGCGLAFLKSPLFFFFVPTEGGAMCGNRLALLVSFIACPQPGLGPVCTACIPQGPGLQTSAEASCLVCSSVPGKPCHTQPGLLWVHPVSTVAACLGAIGSGQICGCAVNLFSFLEGNWWLRGKEELQNVKPSSGL